LNVVLRVVRAVIGAVAVKACAVIGAVTEMTSTVVGAVADVMSNTVVLTTDVVGWVIRSAAGLRDGRNGDCSAGHE
jgi:hypothetical protein